MELSKDYLVTLVLKTLEVRKSIYYRDIKKKTSSIKTKKDKELNIKLLEEIKTILKKHSFWGYRRVWAYLRYVRNYQINLKRIYRLMKEEELLQKKKLTLKARRTPMKKPRATKPREILGIDGTKFWIEKLGWANLIIVIDWYTKEILGYEISLRNKNSQWISALQEALFNGYPEGAKGKGIKLVSDHGNQPTSKSFVKFYSEQGRGYLGS